MLYTATALFQKEEAPAPPAYTGLIDAVGVSAVAALGFKKLRNAYTGDCIKVRRESDNATLDIGFDANGDLDTAAIATFCGSSQGTIQVWYDQSGNGFDFNTTNTPQAGGLAEEPIIYFNYPGTGYAVTTDAAGNISAFSREPGNISTTGTRFLNSPIMTAKQSPTITMLGQVNTFSSIGIMTSELDNGYNLCTYGSTANRLTVIRSNGNNIKIKTGINTDATDPWASTIFYCDDCGTDASKWWITSHLNNATFEDSMTVTGFNAATYNNATIFRYYSATLYQNCALNGYIYWDVTDGTTLTAQQLYDLYDWVGTNLGFTNNAPTP